MSNDTLRGELERLVLNKYPILTSSDLGKLGARSQVYESVALDLLATNRAQAEEIEKLKEEMKTKDARIISLESRSNENLASVMTELAEKAGVDSVLRHYINTLIEHRLKDQQERDARTQEAAQAQARVKELAGVLLDITCYQGGADQATADEHLMDRAADALSDDFPTAALDALLERVREGEREKVDALEGVLRRLASWVGNGGFNPNEVDPTVFEAKIRDGVDFLIRVEVNRALSNADTRAHEFWRHTGPWKSLREAIHGGKPAWEQSSAAAKDES